MQQRYKYVIKEFEPNYLDKVIFINKRELPENYPAYFFLEHHRRYPKAFLVAEVDGEVVGYIMCRIELGYLFTNPSRTGRRGHIISIAVLREFQRRGIGRQLMESAMRSMKNEYGVDEYYLEVRVSNEPAIRLYRKLGFSVVKTIPRYYLDGETAYVMARPALDKELG